MLVIGARFRTFGAARAALRAVRASVPVPEGDVAVRALGSTAYDRAPANEFLLAGRFEPEDAAAVAAIVTAEGGSVVERRDIIERPAAVAPSAQRQTAERMPTTGAARPRRFGSGRREDARWTADRAAPLTR